MPIIRSIKARVIICEEEEGTGAIYPIGQDGTYPPIDEWEITKTKIDMFYKLFSDSEIEEHNREIKEHNQKIVDESRMEFTNLEFHPASKEKKPGFVYLLHHDGLYKIGMATKLSRRLMQISPRMPHEVTLIHSIKTDDMVGLEALLHECYADKRMNGEWFALSDEDVRDIQNGEYHNE